MEIIQNDDGNSNNSEVTEKLIDDIINNKSKIIYTPICGELAYLPVEVNRGEFVHSNHIQKSEGNRKAKKRGSQSA